MTTLNGTQPIAVSSLKKLELPEGALRQRTAQEMASAQKMREMTLMPKYSHIEGPADQAYATVQVGGKTVATLYNSGAAETPNSLQGKFNDVWEMFGDMQGPQLAQARAEEIAARLGGKVVKSGTAQAQTQWEATPKQHLVTDWDALRRDPRIASYYKVDSDTLVQMQLLGREDHST